MILIKHCIEMRNGLKGVAVGVIFVTVGTHEQQFNRLVEYVDNLKTDGTIQEEIIIQTGFSTYEPKNCKWNKLFCYQEMEKLVYEARIVITHGGPSSFIAPLQIGKIPVVVPRKYELNEHINNHQVLFCRAVAERNHNIIVIDNINELKDVILRYDKIVASMPKKMTSNNKKFCDDVEKLVFDLVGHC